MEIYWNNDKWTVEVLEDRQSKNIKMLVDNKYIEDKVINWLYEELVKKDIIKILLEIIIISFLLLK